MPNGLVLESHLNTGQCNHLNTRQMDATFFSYVLVWYSNGRASTQPQIDHLNTEPFEIRIQKGWYSNVSGIQMVSIQIPTVLRDCLGTFLPDTQFGLN